MNEAETHTPGLVRLGDGLGADARTKAVRWNDLLGRFISY